MSATTPRQRLGRLFNRRDVSGAASEPASHGPPPTTETRENRHVRRKSSLRSLREFVQNTSRSLSQTRNPLKRGPSEDTQNTPNEQSASDQPTVVTGSLPQIEHQTDLASDLAHLVLTEDKESRPRIDSVPNQPVLRRKLRKLSHETGETDRKYSTAHAVQINTLMVPATDPYSELVADWNIPQTDTPLLGALDDLPAPLKVIKSRSSDLSSGSPGSRTMPGQLTRKPHIQDLRKSIERDDYHRGRRRSSGYECRSIRRSSLQKPLPELPRPLNIQHTEERRDSGVDSELGKDRGYLVKDATEPIDLKDVVDLSNTEQSETQRIWAPAVTHEKRTVNTHEIVQHAITREIHNHHIFHRILPIVDIEVLPARHFVPTEDGGLAEIAAEDAPVDSAERLQLLISEAVANMLPKSEEPTGPRDSSARSFEGDEGDYSEYTTPEGIKRTEQWWIHPPTVETGAKEDGQTAPFHMNSEDPAEDDLRGGLSDAVAATTMTSEQPRVKSSVWKNSIPQHSGSSPTHHTILPIKMTHGATQQVY